MFFVIFVGNINLWQFIMSKYFIRQWHSACVDAWLYVLIFLSAGVLFYLRSEATIPMEDNYYFAFVKFDFEKVAPDYVPRHFADADDMIASLTEQYNGSHGRIPAIFMTMLFMGVIGLRMFYIINTVAFLIVSYLAAAYMFSRKGLTPLKLLATIAVLLYCLPQTATLWYCPVLSFNYLWPLGGTLVFLMIWSRDRLYRWWQVALLCVVCYLAGWSHEAFSLPVLCTVLLMYISRYRRLSASSVVYAVSYLAGVATMLLSPGMWIRTDGALGTSPGLLSLIGNGVLSLITNIPFDLLLVALIILFYISKSSGKAFFKHNLIDVSIVLFSAGMVVALTLGFTRGSIALSFFSIVLIARILSRYIIKRCMPRWVVGSALALFVIHQSAIVIEARRHYNHFDKMVGEFLATPSGTVVYEHLAVALPLTSPWVEPWDIDFANDVTFDRAREMGISYYYSHPWHQPLHVVHPAEAYLLEHPDALFIDANRVPGSAGFYTVQDVNHMFIPVNDDSMSVKTFTVRYDLSDNGVHLPWKKRMKLRLYGLPDSAPLHTVIFEYDGRRYVAATKEKDMPVKAIDVD